jgi:hypothetical protein
MVDFLRQLFSTSDYPKYGVVALLDDAGEAFVQSIWRDFENEFDIQHPFATPVPHVTHIQAEDIRQDDLEAALTTFAEQQAPYTLHASGLGIFTGEKTVVYMALVRNLALNHIHSRLIDSLYSTIEGMSEEHLINYWMPHISLLVPGMGSNQLADVIQFLSAQSFERDITVSKLALLDGSDKSASPYFTINLTGQSS